MTTTASHSPTASIAHLSPWLWQVIRPLCEMVAARGGRNHAMIPLVNAAWSKLSRTAQKFERLVARVLAGRRAPMRKCGLTRTQAVREATSSDAFRLPRNFGWLIQAIQETAQLRYRVMALLDDPEMAALLAAEPGAGRILRPLCWMLMIPPGPAAIPPAARRPRRKRAARPKPARKPQRQPPPARKPARAADIWAVYGSPRPRKPGWRRPA